MGSLNAAVSRPAEKELEVRGFEPLAFSLRTSYAVFARVLLTFTLVHFHAEEEVTLDRTVLTGIALKYTHFVSLPDKAPDKTRRSFTASRQPS